jgi:predicted DNA binding CopG/RHH family protein
MSQKSKKTKATKLSDESRWEEAASIFENESMFAKIVKDSRVLTATEERELLGPGRTKQISIRLPEKDLDAVKQIASATDRPYQQLVVLAVQQYIDRIASTLVKHRK